MKIYCLKCKTKTETNSTIQSKSKNNRDIVKGVCSVCGMNKSIFVRGTASTGKGFSLNNLINSFISLLKRGKMFREVLLTTNKSTHIVDQVPDMINE